MNLSEEKLIELYKNTSPYESGILMKNAIQNILDYRIIVAANINDFSNVDIYKSAINLLFENCKNSIFILDTLALTYNLDALYGEDLNDKEKIGEFTRDFVIKSIF